MTLARTRLEIFIFTISLHEKFIILTISHRQPPRWTSLDMIQLEQSRYLTYLIVQYMKFAPIKLCENVKFYIKPTVFLNWPWWRHQIETFSALLAICAGNSPATGEFPAQRPVTRSFDVFPDLRLNRRLSKVSNHEVGDLRLYREHYDVTVMQLGDVYMRRRCAAVRQANRGHTQYWLCDIDVVTPNALWPVIWRGHWMTFSLITLDWNGQLHNNIKCTPNMHFQLIF